MSTSCKHRWVTAEVVMSDLATPDDIDIEFVAHDGCAAMKTYVQVRVTDDHVLSIEAMGTRFQHFTRWLERQVSDES